MPFQTNERVTWREGRSQRPRQGVVEKVRDVPGWPSEYDVRPLKQNGQPSVQVRLKHESELERCQ